GTASDHPPTSSVTGGSEHLDKEKKVNLSRALETPISVKSMVVHRGELYFINGSVICRLTKYFDGHIETIAGTGDEEFNGDHLATETSLAPKSIVSGPNGLNIIDGESRIRTLVEDDNGKFWITTVAGTGMRSFNGDGFSTQH